MPTITTCEPANDDQQATCQADIVSSDNQPDNLLISPDCGRKITFDNHDDRQEVHYMTEDHQNIDEHVVTFMASENIIPAYSLSDKVPENGVLQMDNGECLPNQTERELYSSCGENHHSQHSLLEVSGRCHHIIHPPSLPGRGAQEDRHSMYPD